MSSKQGNGKNCDDCGYDASNKRHEQSYWEDRRDPRDRDEKDFRFNSHYYAAIDRQIAENHATECKSKGNNRAAKK